MNRRDLLKAFSSVAILTSLSPTSVFSQPLQKYPFTLGVASGDPLPDGFVIWTRLAPEPLERASGMPMQSVPVRWEVATDDNFTEIVAKGDTLARPELGHAVHIEVAGMQPARRYWYRFMHGDAISPVGTVKSAPGSQEEIDQLRIGVAGCQHYESGYYTAYHHLSQEPDLDAIFHYGDYIYEYRSGRSCQDNCFRRHVGDEIYTLDDYRRRYAQYKLDPNLQQAHAAAAFLSTYDDHEIDNNWASIHDEQGTPSNAFVLRRFAAFQAWYENMPVRISQFPAEGHIQAFRRLDYGRLLRIHLLDTRQYRSDQLCGLSNTEFCRPPTDQAPSHMLGNAQENWLSQGLDRDSTWHLLAQQCMVMPFMYPGDRGDGRVNLDSWSGYPDARQRVVDMIAAKQNGKVIIATGDVHKHHAGVLPLNPEDPEGAAVATEYVTTSITSSGDGSEIPAGWENVPGNNPHTRLLNDRRGYQVFTITPTQWQTDVITVDYVTREGAARHKLATLVTLPGKAGINMA